MVAHAVAQGDDGAESPEASPAAFAWEEQAEESEEREECTRIVMVELEAVVAPVERAALAAGFGHLAVFVHRHIDKGAALERIGLFILFVDIDADKSRNEHLCHFFLVEGPAHGVTVIGMFAFTANGLRCGVEVGRYNLETAEGKAKGECCGCKPDAFTACCKRVAMECGFVERVKTCAPQEEIRELQVASENHPCDAQCKDDEVGEASVTDNLADGKEGQWGNRKDHHLSVVTTVNVSEVFRRKCVEESEKRTPPLVAGQVPGEEHCTHEGDPHGQDELETDGTCRIHDELRPHERVVSIGKERVNRRDTAKAAIVPFREDDVERAQNAAADAVQLVAVEHELTGIESEIAEYEQQNRKENCGHCHNIRKYKNTAEVARYGLLNCLLLNEFAIEPLFERIFVGLGRLDEAVDAECRNDADGDEYGIFDQFAHEFLLEFFYKNI